MAGGRWERLATEIIIPELQEAAAELNCRAGIAAEYSEHPFGDACLLWIARRLLPSPFLSSQGSLVIYDEPALAMVRIEEADPRVSEGRPMTRVYLRRSAVSSASIKAEALAFAERLISVESEPAQPGSQTLDQRRPSAAPRYRAARAGLRGDQLQ
jgi:hypothetical protein